MGKLEIYQLRIELAKRRQPEHADAHTKLMGLVPVDDFPYRGSLSGCYPKLLKQPEFCHPSRGRRAQPDAEFLYLIAEVDKFLREINAPPELQLLKYGDITATGDKFWELVHVRGLKAKEEWVPLSTITQGVYGRDPAAGEDPKQQIYWWSDLPLAQENLVRDMRRRGLAKDWFSGRCVVLRCRLTADLVAATQVPSVLDGFASDIFLPTDSELTPPTGQAIDLTADSLKLGAGEFILGPVAASHIEFRFLEVTKAENDAFAAHSGEPAFQERLEKYYRSLL
ncbi:MAG TPA: hypothetical protein VGH73_05870 [Thermoanaerobaculia bacterium]|jgi:hypothetical protein